MDLSNFDPRTGLFRASAVQELDFSGIDIEENAWDYIVGGTLSTATSAVLGIINTGIAVGEVLNIADEDSYIDEAEAIGTLFGSRVQDFYLNHKAGVDVTGLVVGSFVPGLAAIRALRAAQRAGKIFSPFQTTTGLKNSDLVLGSKVVEGAKQSVLRTGVAGLRNQQVRQSYMAGVTQQFMESAAFDMALVTTMNQNAALNPDDLGYLESAKNVFIESIPFTFAGGAIGGAFEIAKIKGAINKNTLREFARTGQYLAPNLEGLTGMKPGDKMVTIAQAFKDHSALKNEIAGSDEFALAQFNKGQALLKSELNKAITELNVPDAYTADLLQKIVLNSVDKDIKQVANIISGLTKVSRPTATDVKELNAFYQKTAVPSGIIDSPGAPSQYSIDELQLRYANKLEELGFEEYAAKVVGAVEDNILRLPKNSAGTALPKDINSLGIDGIKVTSIQSINDVLAFIPDFATLNNSVINDMYSFAKDFAIKSGREFNITAEEYKQYVIMHELGHIKTNKPKTMNMIYNHMLEGTGKKLLEDLISASVESRPETWHEVVAGFNKFNNKQIVQKVMDDIVNNFSFDSMPSWMSYVGHPTELLADAASYMTREVTRQKAAKQFPTLAKFFNAKGSIARSWQDTKAFYHTRTGQVHTSYLPGINDISKTAKIVKDALVVPELGRNFARSTSLFSEESLKQQLAEGTIDYLDFDAQWNMYSKMDVAGMFDKAKEGVKETLFDINNRNLPLLERVLQTATEDETFRRTVINGGFVKYNGKELRNIDDVATTLIREKQDLQLELVLLSERSKLNEHHIAKILNIDVPRAQGFKDGELILFGKKDFNNPEILRFEYKSQLPEDYNQVTVDYAATSIRKQLVGEQKQNAAAAVLEDTYQLLPDIELEHMGSVAPTNTRATLFGALRTEIGSLREKAAFVGKILSQKISNRIKDVDQGYVKFYDTFNKPGNKGIRFELAQVDNLLRRQWYYHAVGSNGNQYIVSKKALHNYMKEFGDEIGEVVEFDPRELENLDENLINNLKGLDVDGDPAVVQLSKDVGEFYQHHVKNNSKIVDKKLELGAAYGKDPVLDRNVLYPPPKNLSQYRFTAFVVPNAFQSGSDPRKFMIFAETEAEFHAKQSAITSKYGDNYRIITRRQVDQYKKLVKEYDQDKVFDELYFDAGLSRKGRTSELTPNLDLQSSQTLERYRNWTIRQEEYLLRAGVELRYDDVIQSLRGIDEQFSSAEKSAIDKRYREQDSIWQDTVSIMLNQKSYGGKMEDLFVRINDYIGTAGSKVIDGAFNVLRKPAGVALNEKDYKEFNKQLADAGYNPPTYSVVEAMLTSPETQRSATLPHLVRTLSNLTSTLMLRLDPAHSFIQLVSTPILALPVIREAKQALRGTEAGKQLENMTGVINPSNGQYEPSASKLFAEGTTAFWSPAGKEFLQQLKDRNIVSDYLIQYLDTLDFSSLEKSKTLQKIGDKIDNLAQFGQKFSGFRHAEEFTRFQVAWAVKRIGELRGLNTDEMWATISGSVDKVHGVYIGNQRTQLFQGVLGQAVGLYQTYFFNFMQNMAKYVGEDRRNALVMAGMQSSIFGLQSWPGFGTLNQLVGETNRGNLDLYNVTNADDPNSMSAYFMYGLASHSLGFPIDFYSRGDLAVRHPMVVPTSIDQFPVVSTISKAVANVANTIKLATDDNVSIGQALVHGLAHNGMNRPMQGLGNIIRNKITSNHGQVQFDNANFVDYNMQSELNWGAMFARAIGTRPMNEAIIQDAYYRDAAYQANYRKELINLGKKIKLNSASGTLSSATYVDFAREYEKIGGDVQNFNAYFMRALKDAKRPVMEQFARDLRTDTELARIRTRLAYQQSVEPLWENDPL